MKKTILLGIKHINFPKNVWLSVLIGLIYFFLGITSLNRNNNPLDLIFGLLLAIGGIWYLLYALLAFNKYSRYAPRFSLDDNELLFKETILKQPVTFVWNQIKKIELGPYQMMISTDGLDQTLYYSTKANTSKEIKSAIREIAESKQIEVIGG